MGAVAEQVGPGHPLEQGFDLSSRQSRPGLDGRPAGHRRENPIDPVLPLALAALAAELPQHIEKQLLRRTLPGQRRHAGDDIGVAAEVPKGEPHPLQFGKMLFDQAGLEQRQLGRQREEQVLAGDPVAAVLAAQVFKQQALVGGVLVDQYQALVVLAQDIEVVELTDDLQAVMLPVRDGEGGLPWRWGAGDLNGVPVQVRRRRFIPSPMPAGRYGPTAGTGGAGRSARRSPAVARGGRRRRSFSSGGGGARAGGSGTGQTSRGIGEVRWVWAGPKICPWTSCW